MSETKQIKAFAAWQCAAYEACESLAEELGSEELTNQVLDAINDGILTADEAKSALNAVQDPTWWAYDPEAGDSYE